MKIFYFVHVTGRDSGSSGISRVVRGLGRALVELGAAPVTPVRWSSEHQAVVYAEQIFFDTLHAYNGPTFVPNDQAGRPIEAAAAPEDWLVIPEVPHLKSRDARYPSVPLGLPLDYASRLGLRSAVVFHDLLPLTHPEATGADEIERQQCDDYGRSLLKADLVLPVSSFTGASLADWLDQAGYRKSALPRFATVALPEEIAGWPRETRTAERLAAWEMGCEFVTFGTVCARKNQLAAIEAFNRVAQRLGRVPLKLHVIGSIEPELRPRFDRLLGQSAGRVVSHGFLPDEDLIHLVTNATATIFVSKAEGYGLPVAESLWLGAPCLASNNGPMADVAGRGGCLLVNPNDSEDIAAGIERLANDRACYQVLLDEVAGRRFRSWREYGSAVLTALQTHPTQPRSGLVRRLRRRGLVASAGQARPASAPLTILPSAKTAQLRPLDPLLSRTGGNQVVSLRERPDCDLAVLDFGNRLPRRCKLLVIKLDHVGDFFIGLPALEKLRSAFPEDHITLICAPWNEHFARDAHVADEVRTYRFFSENGTHWDGRPVDDIAKFREIAAGQFDIALDLRVNEDTRFLLRHVRARMKCGIGPRVRHPFLDLVLPAQFEEREQHAAIASVEPHFVTPSRFQSRMPVQTPLFHETDFSVSNTHVVFGPDLALPAGRFRATWGLEFSAPFRRFRRVKIEVDVARSSGGEIVARRRVSLRRGADFQRGSAVEFDNDTPGKAHEFRIRLRGRPIAARLRFFGVWVEALQLDPAARVKRSELHIGEHLSLLVQLVEDRVRPLGTVRPSKRASAAEIPDFAASPKGAKRIVVAPTSNSRLRDWGIANYAELAARLLNEENCVIVLVGSAAQRGELNGIESQRGGDGRVVNLAGRTGWEETAAIIRGADLVIANNSGIAHVAAACGTPTLAIYSGSHQPQEWGPRGPHVRALMALVPCSPCGYDRLESCPYDHRCMRLITPEAVAAEAIEMLSVPRDRRGGRA